MEWTDDKVVLLIQQYELFPCLYDCKSADYHNRLKKRRAIETICKELNCPDAEISKKIKYLRNQFVEENRKMNRNKSGMGIDDMYVSKWKFSGLLQFLKNHITTKKADTITNMDLNNVSQDDNNDSLLNDDLFESELNVSTKDSTTSAIDCAASKADFTAPLHLQAKRKKRMPTEATDLSAVQQYFQHKINAMTQPPQTQSASPSSMIDDDDTMFAKLMASDLRLIKNASLKRSVKKKISDTIYEALNEDIELSDSSKVMHTQYVVINSDGSVTPFVAAEFGNEQ